MLDCHQVCWVRVLLLCMRQSILYLYIFKWILIFLSSTKTHRDQLAKMVLECWCIEMWMYWNIIYFYQDTVDGRNPAPPGMYKTLSIMGWTTNLNWWTPDFFHQQYLMTFHDICAPSLSCWTINFQAHSRACAKSGLIRWGNLQGEMPGRHALKKPAFIVFQGEKHGKDYISWANYSGVFNFQLKWCSWGSRTLSFWPNFWTAPSVYVPLTCEVA